MSEKIYPVLLCGGSGTRLWPLSRKSYPKQFARIMGDKSLFQASAMRLDSERFEPPMVVTGSDFRFIVTEQLDAVEIAAASILIEPAGRNTAPAICAAALKLKQDVSDALLLVAPSDHVIPDAAAFRAAVLAAAPSARDGQLITFGIYPDRPETGYGWLELDQPSKDLSGPTMLKRFVEKPDQQTAQHMLEAGTYLWNAGIFLFSVSTILNAFERFAPNILAGAQSSVDAATTDLGFTLLAAEPWQAIPDISIDYAIMEKAENLSVMPYAGAWSDLGGWEAVWREEGPDERGVVTHGAAHAQDCDNSLLRAEVPSQQLVGIGLKDIVAIAMPDAVLIAHKDRAQDVKLAVAALKAKAIAQAETLPRDYRPWGWYESLVVGLRFQVKRIVVHPGAALSLQSHHHRAEHWIVVEGTAKVTINETETLVTENQSVYIPLGAVHRIGNPGKVPLTLIEVQTGSYLGEDDIVRYEDVYART